MSINSCSINEFTINALCGRRRQVIIDGLLARNVDPQKSHVQHVNPNASNLSIYRRSTEDNVVDVSAIEQPQICVTVEFNGQTFSHTLDRGNDVIPMIHVHGVTLSSTEEQVNISDLTIKVI